MAAEDGVGLRLEYTGVAKGSEWLPFVITALNVAVQEATVVTLALLEQKNKKGPLPPDDVQQQLGQMLRTSVFPPVVIAPTGSKPARCFVRACNVGPGCVDLIIAPTTAWPRAFCQQSLLAVRSGAGVVAPDEKKWSDALAEDVNWNLQHRPTVELVIGENVRWAPFPGEETNVEYKSIPEWPVTASQLALLCREHLGPLLRSCSEFTFTLGVEDKSRLPVGLYLDCSHEEVRAAVGTALASFFPPLALEEARVTISAVEQLQAEGLCYVAGKSRGAASCGHKRVAGGDRLQSALVMVEQEDENAEPMHWLASLVEGLAIPGAAEVLTTHIVTVTVKVAAESERQQACCMQVPALPFHSTLARTPSKWPVVRTIEAEAGVFGKAADFDPLAFFVQARGAQQRSLQAAALQQHCFKAVLFAGDRPPCLPSLREFEWINVANDDTAEQAAASYERLVVIVAYLTESTWIDVVTAVQRASSRLPQAVQVVALLDEGFATVLPRLLAFTQLPDKLPFSLVDVLLTPPLGDTFADAAAAAGFRLFSGRDEPPARDTLLRAAKHWLQEGAHLPPDAFVERIVPVLNGQVQQLVDQVSAILCRGLTGVQPMVASQLFRQSGTSTLLRHVAALSARLHEGLVFADACGGARWTSELIGLLPSVPFPLIAVAESKEELALLRAAAPASLLVVLSSELILDRSLRQLGVVFVPSPLIDANKVEGVCDALAAIIPDRKESILALKVLKKASEPLHRHLLVFLVAALHGDVLLSGIQEYVKQELTQLGPLKKTSAAFLSTLSFLGFFTSCGHQFLPLAAHKEELGPIMERGSLLFQDRTAVAVWHPWVAKEMLTKLRPGVFGADILSQDLIRSMRAIDSTSERFRVIHHLLFTRSGKHFSVLMQWCTNYLKRSPEHNMEFPIELLRGVAAYEEEWPAFKAHCHLLWSRVLRQAGRLEDAIVEADIALELEASFPSRQNRSLLQLETSDARDLPTALADYALLYNGATRESQQKLRKTALRFLGNLPKKDQLKTAELFGITKRQFKPMTEVDDTFETHYVVNRAAHNMPAMRCEELSDLLGVAPLIECIVR